MRLPGRVPALLALLIVVVSAPAQAESVDNPIPSGHRFWDRENLWLFSGVTAARFLDYNSTQHMRSLGNNEILLTNDIVDNKPLFATIELAGVAASIGISYLFHHTGHHRLERWTSYVHIGVATFGSVRNYSLDNQHPHPPVP